MELWDGWIMDYQQNKIAYVTGVSRGIGKALVNELLSNGYFVIGIARTNPNVEHPNFIFEHLDLSDIEKVQEFKFSYIGKEMLLVHNAGQIGGIKPIGELSAEEVMDALHVNLGAILLMTNTFVKQIEGKARHKHVLAISSGAAQRNIDAWSTYCTTKAGLDMYMSCLAQELKDRNKTGWFVHSIAPGVIDTAMQSAIRNANESDFLQHQRFVNLKESNSLKSPERTAKQLINIIKTPENLTLTISRLED